MDRKGIDSVLNCIYENDDAFHNYPWLVSFYNKVMELKPKRIKELGGGTGATTLVLAQAIYDLNNGGSVVTIDSYPAPSTYGIIKNMFPHLFQIIKFNYNTHFELSDYTDKMEDDFDLLYVDLANNVDTIRSVIDYCNYSGIENKHIIFEGGCLERDVREIKDKKYFMTNLKDRLHYEILDDTYSCVSYFYLTKDSYLKTKPII